MKQLMILAFALITILLASGSCTKKVEETPAAAENLTVIIGSISERGDTTIYLQTVVRPH
jgi:hypothetical protein